MVDKGRKGQPKAQGQFKEGPWLQPATTETPTYAEQGIDKRDDALRRLALATLTDRERDALTVEDTIGLEGPATARYGDLLREYRRCSTPAQAAVVYARERGDGPGAPVDLFYLVAGKRRPAGNGVPTVQGRLVRERRE